MKILIVFLLVLATGNSERRQYGQRGKQDLRLGGLFEGYGNGGISHEVFTYATDWVNENNILPEFNLITDPHQVDDYDSYKISLTVCELMYKGVAGIFGPRSVHTSDHVQSMCDALEIPHVEMRWDSRQRRSSCLVNLYPHPSTLSKVLVDLVKLYEWKSFTVVYEDNDGLIRLSGLLSYYDHDGHPVTARQLQKDGNYRATFRKIKATKVKNIVLDCSHMILYEVLLQAQQIGVIGAEYNYIITSMDFHILDLEQFKYAGTNITGIRLFDPASTKIQDIISFWSEKNTDFRITSETLTVELALIHDAVILYSKAVHELQKSLSIHLKSLDCTMMNSWEFGYSIINYMKVSEFEGLTGLIKFDHEGFRTDFKLEIFEVNPDGIKNIAMWNATGEMNFTQTIELEGGNHTDNKDLSNVTFVVLISLLDPHAMFKEETEHLVGNDKYEGMAIDVIHELSLLTGFNYTFKEQKEGGSGNLDEVTGKWDGMIGEICENRADLAIADISITRKRQQVVDFTLPYMNLGISILYKKPTKAPNLFSFMAPFTDRLWKCVFGAYICVSIIMYIVGRISPMEWTNPYDCVDDDDLEGLENQFTLNNSFWFVMGALMQQGSELGPISYSTRLLGGCWCFFVLIIVNTYTANLAAFLTIEQKVELFSNVDELAFQKASNPVFVKYGAKIRGATEEFFKFSNHSTYQVMWQYMQENYNDVMVRSNNDGVNRVLSKSEEYAFLMEDSSIEYEVQRHCELRQVGKPLDSKGYGIAMAKGAWFRNTLSTSVVRLQEKQVFDKLYKKWWREKRGGGACAEKSSGDAVSLGLDNVGGLFIILVVGSSSAIFVAFGELMYDVYMKPDRGPFWKEVKKELKFVINLKKTVKKLKESSEESALGEENTNPEHI